MWPPHGRERDVEFRIWATRCCPCQHRRLSRSRRRQPQPPCLPGREEMAGPSRPGLADRVHEDQLRASRRSKLVLVRRSVRRRQFATRVVLRSQHDYWTGTCRRGQVAAAHPNERAARGGVPPCSRHTILMLCMPQTPAQPTALLSAQPSTSSPAPACCTGGKSQPPNRVGCHKCATG